MNTAQRRQRLSELAERQAEEAAHLDNVRIVQTELHAASAAFVAAWDTLSGIVHRHMKLQGFDGQKVFPADIALMHSELSESLEADRKNAFDDKLSESEGRAVELADTIIRILHAQGKYGLESIGKLVVQKSLYNTTRPYKHGKEY